MEGRRAVRGVVVLVAAVLLLAGCYSEDQVKAQSLVNSARQTYRVAPVADLDQSYTKAQAWAERLARQGYLSHSSLADGYGGVAWCGLAENVGMGSSVEGVQAAFMNSAQHKANILNSAYDHAGTGVATSANGTVFVVQEFANLC